MAAPVIHFETAIAIGDEERIATALIEGSLDPADLGACVAVLICSRETAEALIAAVGSALKMPEP